jgi:hypothetical protein
MKMSLLFVAAVLCCADQTSAEEISLANRGGFASNHNSPIPSAAVSLGISVTWF